MPPKKKKKVPRPPPLMTFYSWTSEFLAKGGYDAIADLFKQMKEAPKRSFFYIYKTHRQTRLFIVLLF